MLKHLLSFPEQWRIGRERALQADLSAVRPARRPVLIAGMGGSAISGDLLRTLALDQGRVPVLVLRGYTLPAWVGPDDPVIVSSFSGNTEETLSACTAALARGAAVACITSNGTLAGIAADRGLPLIRIANGMPPRAALGVSLTAMLTIGEALGIVQIKPDAWREAQEVLEAQTEALAPSDANEGHSIATALHGLFPFIYSSEGLLEGVNVRWRNQMHENAKTPATGNVFPELNHNEIMGWEWKAGDTGRIGVVVLHDEADHPQVTRRMAVTRGLLEKRAGCWIDVHSRGTHPLARILSLINLGDWVSYYLAELNGEDPTPIGLIDRLKAAMASE